MKVLHSDMTERSLTVEYCVITGTINLIVPTKI